MTDKVKLMWNGQQIEAEKGSNLLKAALDNGIEVAHYCYHRGLSVAGVCRMCMVEQEGVPRPFPACNATVAENIVVNNESAKVKSAVEATLQFHLVNHPLDCPVCDQAGECGLQDNYMLHGKYDSSMIDKKVHKDKVQDIGRDVMLDAERCILCSRCVRFTKEVTKTNEMGILNRGDHAEITCQETLKNDYAQNLVDVCPVGALTSKDFRFKQRAWFLTDVETICIGCEVGCAVKVSQNKTGAYRVRPVFDEAVNGHWMCDDGRSIYKHVSAPTRLISSKKKGKDFFVNAQDSELKNAIAGKKPAFILSTFLTNEEYEKTLSQLKKIEAKVALFSLKNEGPEFDGILKRGNKNPNAKGAEVAFAQFGYDATPQGLDHLLKSIDANTALFLVIPEMMATGLMMDDFKTLLAKMAASGVKIALTPNESFKELSAFDYLAPVPTFLEKSGTMTNFQGQSRSLTKGLDYGETSKSVSDYAGWVSV